jgi:deazaflavin-dependent oxidoreductase (nitroreductase family)
MWAMHRFFLRLSGGRLGSKVGGNPVLLLTTTGRKSGQPRTVALSYWPDAEGYVVIASNGGEDRDPAWWLNLKDNPQAAVRIGSRETTARAEEATGEERERLWGKVKASDPQYAGYEKLTKRQIPVVVLRPD